MGFMGIASIGESDSAADMAYSIVTKLAENLRKELKDTGNQYNTDGALNIAMFIRDMIVPANEYYYFGNEEMHKLAKDILPKIKKQRNAFSRPQTNKDLEELIVIIENFIKQGKENAHL